MKCPECGWDQPDTNRECQMCGVIFAKLGNTQASVDNALTPPVPAPADPLAPRHLDGKGWANIGLGLGLAIVALVFTLPRIALDGLRTLFHEFGHALTGWLFGCPGIPAFDLQHGGGIAVIWEQKPALLVLVYGLLAAAFYTMRRNRSALAVLTVLTLIYAALAHTDGREVVYLFMGHGMELVFGGIFLYRGISGRSVINPLERPLYTTVGSFLIFRDLGFAWNLMFSETARITYRLGKGTLHNDFHRIAENYLHTTIPAVAAVLFVCALLTPLLAGLAYRYQAKLYLLIDDLTERGGED